LLESGEQQEVSGVDVPLVKLQIQTRRSAGRTLHNALRDVLIGGSMKFWPFIVLALS